MWLYDAKRNVLTEYLMSEVAEIYGVTTSNISRLLKRGSKLERIDCYIFKEKPSLIERRKLYEQQIFVSEAWRNLPGTNYDVSNYGRVRLRKNTKTFFILPFLRRGHMYIKLNVKGGAKAYALRNVVARVYLKEEKGKKSVKNKNGDTTDCTVWNLKRVSYSEIARKKGKNGSSKAVVLIDIETKEVIDSWTSARKASLDMYLSRQSITDRCNGIRKSLEEGWFMWEEDYEKVYGVPED